MTPAAAFVSWRPPVTEQPTHGITAWQTEANVLRRVQFSQQLFARATKGISRVLMSVFINVHGEEALTNYHESKALKMSV